MATLSGPLVTLILAIVHMKEITHLETPCIHGLRVVDSHVLSKDCIYSRS